MTSYQNLIVLQNLYKLKALGFEYTEHFTLNEQTLFDKPNSLNELHKNIHSCHLCDLANHEIKVWQELVIQIHKL